VADAIVAALAAVTPLEWLAVLLAIAYLLLAIRQNPWCWAFAIVSAALYLVLFARAGLVMQSALQLFFVAMAVYGWRTWRGTASSAPLPVRRWPWPRHLWALGGVGLVTAVNGAMIAHDGAGWVPYADAGVAWASVFTTWLVARKLLENWLWWIGIDVVAATLYGTQGLYATAALYLLYTVLAVRGFQSWQRDVPTAEPARA
jgi:nicotinamide mononucleotide transporter